MTNNKIFVHLVDKTSFDKNGEPKILRGTPLELHIEKNLSPEFFHTMNNNARINNSYYEKTPIFIEKSTGKYIGFQLKEIKRN
ncbi:hypothetical protein NSA42_03070 [Paeniclostridium sordellii]|uniref:hypothetical protein n=1 Tax=Paraclostridium sordellii TaxID=1505 RepID=UPI001C8B68DF|nr:hypothetical protein [Paeniclostridium sordellii]MBX9179379.1 hypothetical protein [Paeniclostridium sordellii]MCR1848250.1 hypothetical protein [Paeniclostridium sordellii]